MREASKSGKQQIESSRLFVFMPSLEFCRRKYYIMKKNYRMPEIKVVELEATDIIAESGWANGEQTGGIEED